MSELLEPLEVRRVPVAALHPNPWNPNKQDERTYAAERESIREHGFIDPVLVRPHPDHLGEWQIIDGEHRWRAAQDEGATEIDIIPRAFTDTAAKKLTIILNETRGNADVALLGKLIADLSTELSPEDLRLGLPYSDAEMKHLLDVGKLDWDQFKPGGDLPPDPGGGGGDDEGHAVTLRFDDDGIERFRNYTTMIERERGSSTEEAVLWALHQQAQTF